MNSTFSRIVFVFVILFKGVSGLIAEPVGDYTGDDGWRMLGHALPFALKGNGRATHDCFLASYQRASSPFSGGEDCEAIGSGLSEILFRRGDRAFSRALVVERPEIIAAVKFWIRQAPGFYYQQGFKSFRLDGYPKTKKTLDSVADADFPLEENSPRRPSLLKQMLRK